MLVAFKTQNCSLVTPEISRKKCLRVDDSDAPVFVLVMVVIHFVSLNSFRRILKESLTNAVAMFLIKRMILHKTVITTFQSIKFSSRSIVTFNEKDFTESSNQL